MSSMWIKVCVKKVRIHGVEKAIRPLKCQNLRFERIHHELPDTVVPTAGTAARSLRWSSTGKASRHTPNRGIL